MRTNRFLILLLSITAALLISASSDLPPTPASAEIKTELSAAFFRRLQDTNQLSSLTFELFSPELDTAFTSPDGETAVLWLALRDDFGRLLATEPDLRWHTAQAGVGKCCCPATLAGKKRWPPFRRGCCRQSQPAD